MIAEREVEQLFLDYKRATTLATETKLKGEDAKNYAKAISGFGNSVGGLVVWGVDCSRNEDGEDEPNGECLIDNVVAFKSKLDARLSGMTMPPHSLVENFPLPIEGGPAGFVVTYVPSGMNVPLMAIGTSKPYYLRAGSSFAEIPHAVLAGMFGKQPQPYVVGEFRLADHNPVNDGQAVDIVLHFFVKNIGRAATSALHVTFATPSGNAKGVTADRNAMNSHMDGDRLREHLTSNDKFRAILPDESRMLCKYTVSVSSPNQADVTMRATVGTQIGSATLVECSVSRTAIDAVFAAHSLPGSQLSELAKKREQAFSILWNQLKPPQ